MKLQSRNHEEHKVFSQGAQNLSQILLSFKVLQYEKNFNYDLIKNKIKAFVTFVVASGEFC